MCSGQPFFCSLTLSRICALAEDVAVDARDVWGLQCNSSVFCLHLSNFNPHPAVDLYDNFNCCWWIYSKFSLVSQSLGVSDHDPTEHRDLQHCYGISMGGTSYQSSMVVTFSSMVFWGSFPNPKPGNALLAGAIDNYCTPTKPDQFLGIC